MDTDLSMITARCSGLGNNISTRISGLHSLSQFPLTMCGEKLRFHLQFTTGAFATLDTNGDIVLAGRHDVLAIHMAIRKYISDLTATGK